MPGIDAGLPNGRNQKGVFFPPAFTVAFSSFPRYSKQLFFNFGAICRVVVIRVQASVVTVKTGHWHSRLDIRKIRALGASNSRLLPLPSENILNTFYKVLPPSHIKKYGVFKIFYT